jgi:hypothetical protein
LATSTCPAKFPDAIAASRLSIRLIGPISDPESTKPEQQREKDRPRRQAELEAEGYLSRERGAADRRRHVVRITLAGQPQLARAAQAQRDPEDELFARFTDAQRSQLRALLRAAISLPRTPAVSLALSTTPV